MRIRVAFLALGALAMSLPAGGGSPALAGPGERHSGTVIKVDLQASVLTVREMAEAATVRKLQIRITPETRMVLSERLPDTQLTDLRNPFRDTPISLRDVRPGDFVVVELSGKGEPAEASAVTVTFRGR